jgi:hypothetical protein
LSILLFNIQVIIIANLYLATLGQYNLNVFVYNKKSQTRTH